LPASVTGSYSISNPVAVDPLGRILVGGRMGPNGGGKMIIARFTPQGALDPQFGIGGWNTSGSTLRLVVDQNSMLSMTLQPDGKAVLVGTSLGSGGVGFATARFEGDSALLAASLPQHASSKSLTVKEAQPLLTEAEAIWRAAGVDTSTLGAIDIHIADLAGAELGLADEVHHAIWLDDNAAGWGWFVDKTRWNNANYLMPGDHVPRDHMDLLTVVEHEVGHLLGKEHEASGVMADTLSAGVRRTPGGSINSLVTKSRAIGTILNDD
jgi:hypothetical protein